MLFFRCALQSYSCMKLYKAINRCWCPVELCRIKCKYSATEGLCSLWNNRRISTEGQKASHTNINNTESCSKLHSPDRSIHLVHKLKFNKQLLYKIQKKKKKERSFPSIKRVMPYILNRICYWLCFAVEDNTLIYVNKYK